MRTQTQLKIDQLKKAIKWVKLHSIDGATKDGYITRFGKTDGEKRLDTDVKQIRHQMKELHNTMKYLKVGNRLREPAFKALENAEKFLERIGY